MNEGYGLILKTPTQGMDLAEWLAFDMQEHIRQDLQLANAKFVGAVEVKRPEIRQWAVVRYTVLREKETGRYRLFCSNHDNVYGYSDPEDTRLLYPAAKELWEEEFPEVPFPPLHDYLDPDGVINEVAGARVIWSHLETDIPFPYHWGVDFDYEQAKKVWDAHVKNIPFPPKHRYNFNWFQWLEDRYQSWLNKPVQYKLCNQ